VRGEAELVAAERSTLLSRSLLGEEDAQAEVA
jgi:hypothetical protein